LNKDINLKLFYNKANENCEKILNDDIWKEQDIIISAVDKDQAKKF